MNIGAVAIGRNGDGGTPGYVPIAIRTRHYHTLAVASTSPPVMRHVESVERAPGDGPHQRAGLSNERVSTEFGKSPQSRWTRAIASRRPDAHCECPMSPPSDPSISHVSRMYLAHAPSPRPDPASPQRGGQICESDTGRPHRPLEMRRPSRLIAREGPLPRALARPRQALCRALCRVPRGIGVSQDTAPGAGRQGLLARAVS